MYFEELLKQAYLTANQPTDEEIVLLPAGCRSQVDKNMVVPKAVFEEILMNHRATDPTSEAILITIGRASRMPGDPVWDTMIQRENVLDRFTALCNEETAEKLSALETNEQQSEDLYQPPTAVEETTPGPQSGGDGWNVPEPIPHSACFSEDPSWSAGSEVSAGLDNFGQEQVPEPEPEPVQELVQETSSLDSFRQDSEPAKPDVAPAVAAALAQPDFLPVPGCSWGIPDSKDGMAVYLDDASKHQPYNAEVVDTADIEDAPNPGEVVGDSAYTPASEFTPDVEPVPETEEEIIPAAVPEEVGETSVFDTSEVPGSDSAWPPPPEEFGDMPVYAEHSAPPAPDVMDSPVMSFHDVPAEEATLDMEPTTFDYGMDLPPADVSDTPAEDTYPAPPVFPEDTPFPPAPPQDTNLPPNLELQEIPEELAKEMEGTTEPEVSVTAEALEAAPVDVFDTDPEPEPQVEQDSPSNYWGDAPQYMETEDTSSFWGDAPKAAEPVEESAPEPEAEPNPIFADSVGEPTIEPNPVFDASAMEPAAEAIPEPRPEPVKVTEEQLNSVRDTFATFNQLVKQYTLDNILGANNLVPMQFCDMLVEEFPEFTDQLHESLQRYNGDYHRAVMDLVTSLKLEAESAVFNGNLDRAEKCIAPVCKLIYS